MPVCSLLPANEMTAVRKKGVCWAVLVSAIIKIISEYISKYYIRIITSERVAKCA